MDGSAGTAAREGFRPDIEGLRGIAVLLVILFHGSLVVGIPGGFIGVDVFFVISGFLITGLLVRERERSGTISLPAFYARRVRRLLPAGIVALAVTLIASFVILAPLDRGVAALDAMAAAISVGNVRFALAEGDYFAAVSSPSPFLHFWSLAVEEQFYLLWPALVLVASRGRRPRLGAGAALLAVLGISLLANLVVSSVAVNWAFYSLPTRAWQLSLGGLIAIGASHLGRVPAGLTAALGWLGIPALAAAALAFDAGLAYPGAWALVPTLAAAALVNAGMVRRGPGALLAARPLRFFGRISYSLYLWHWPALVLPAIALEAEPPLAVRVVLVAGAVGAAWLSWRFVEEPFRTGFPALSRRPARTVLAGGAAVLALVATAGGFAAAADRVPELLPELAPDPVADVGGDPDVPGEAGIPAWYRVPPSAPPASAPPRDRPDGTVGPRTTAGPAATPQPTPAPVTYVRLPADIHPALARARADEERLRRDGCLAFERVRTPPHCVYGDPHGDFTVALVGDSHAAQWFPAVEAIASARHWRLVTFVKVACPFLDVRVTNLALKREYRECADFVEQTSERLRALRPDLVLVSMSRFAIHPVLERDASIERQGDALARALAHLPGRLALVVDTPDAGRDVPSCLSRHAADTRKCAIPLRVAFARSLGAIERRAAERTGAALIDLTMRVCRGDPCPVAVDGMIVFRDHRHLTATFAASLAPDLERELDRVLAETAD